MGELNDLFATHAFYVWSSLQGLIDENDAEGINLGNFSYQDNGETLQYFPVEVNNLKSQIESLRIFSYNKNSNFLLLQLQETQTESYRYVELRITSNHGNPEYTCLYRFRVHGTPSYA
jgi:SUN domain-containing protein 1/2